MEHSSERSAEQFATEPVWTARNMCWILTNILDLVFSLFFLSTLDKRKTCSIPQTPSGTLCSRARLPWNDLEQNNWGNSMQRNVLGRWATWRRWRVDYSYEYAVWNLFHLPIVDIFDPLWNSSSANLQIMHVFPTPESPTSNSFTSKSYCFAIVKSIRKLTNSRDNMKPLSSWKHACGCSLRISKLCRMSDHTSEISWSRKKPFQHRYEYSYPKLPCVCDFEFVQTENIAQVVCKYWLLKSHKSFDVAQQNKRQWKSWYMPHHYWRLEDNSENVSYC